MISLVIVIIAVVAVLGILSWISPDTLVPLPQATPTTAVPLNTPPARTEWILVDLPANASQLAYGSEVYRLVCETCHGDRGQGLTAAWRATWAPKDQNCWQSKCHAANHPPDGFELPAVPSLLGSTAMSRFATALDLYKYIYDNMPWQDPYSLTQKDSWAVTAYILKINHFDPGSDLNAEKAALITLSSNAPVPTAASAQAPVPATNNWIWVVLTVFVLVIIILIIVYALHDKAGI